MWLSTLFSRLKQSRRLGRSKPRISSVQAGPELLESRLVLYVASGNAWANPALVTISFMPDGTDIGGTPSNMFATFNAKFESEVDLRPAQEVWVDGADGTKVHVFIITPHCFDSSKKYPLILNVHGGPQSQWADSRSYCETRQPQRHAH